MSNEGEILLDSVNMGLVTMEYYSIPILINDPPYYMGKVIEGFNNQYSDKYVVWQDLFPIHILKNDKQYYIIKRSALRSSILSEEYMNDLLKSGTIKKI